MSGPTKTRREVLAAVGAALALPSAMVTSTATVKPDTFGAAYPPGWADKVEYEAFMEVFNRELAHMPKPFKITFTDLAKATAEASSSLAAVEAKARAEIYDHVLWIGEPVCIEMDLPDWGFHAFEMPDGQE